jgi:hypothetical protein
MHGSGASRRENAKLCLDVIARSDLSAVAQRAKAEATKQSRLTLLLWIASQSLSSGAHSRDPLARNDVQCLGCLKVESGIALAPIPWAAF